MWGRGTVMTPRLELVKLALIVNWKIGNFIGERELPSCRVGDVVLIVKDISFPFVVLYICNQCNILVMDTCFGRLSINLLLCFDLLCSFDITDHYSDPM